MKPFDRLSEYLGKVERRMWWLALSRGLAVSAGVALGATVAAVLFANRFNFSAPSVTGARLFLFVALGLVLALGLIGPVIRLNRRRAAREAERTHPQFEERLLTFSERLEENRSDPFLELLASDTLTVSETAQPELVAKNSWILSFSSAAAAALAVLLWMGTAGPGFLGYGTSLLWGGLPKGELKPFYDIAVEPGSRAVRKKADQVISARLIGFSAQKVRFFAKYASGAAWEQAEMKTEPGGTAWEFLLAAVPESLEYYVEAGGVRSKTYKLSVVDLPGVKSIRVTYHYPSWTGMPDFTEFPGGDLRAVEGTNADVAVETDRPLTTGTLLLDDGSKIALRQGSDGRVVASVPIQKDGMYHIAAMESGEVVRLSEDYFIEAQKDRPPEVRVTRPGRDFKASPIEEVTVAVDATDDFGLHAVDLHYSVNGGAEKVVSLLQGKGVKESKGSAVISLEEFKLQPGDVVALYATARDARAKTDTDMFFIEAQPFEREYSQSQQAGGGGGGDEAEDQNRISQRQKEIIAATWNQLKGKGGAADAKENAAFLSGVQAKLRDQAKSLANRMRSRQLAGAGDSFKQFVEDMEKAAEAMGPASDQLKGAKWQDALGPEQKALQHLLRAESTFRSIQVAFGQRGGGGGGGGGGAQRDLEGLFDLELDTEKNQYESGQQVASGEQRQKEIDDALQKLEQLARRQQELAEQERKQPQMSQQRWQQEMLRREAEQLQRQMEQLMRGQQNGQLSRNQDGQQSQNQQGQQGRQQGQGGQSSSASGGLESQQLRHAIERLRQATNDMRQSASPPQSGPPQGDAEARRAADRLREAQQALSRLRQQQSGGQVDDLARKAEQLAGQQEGFDRKMRQAFGAAASGQPSLAQPKTPGQQESAQLAEEKQQMLAELKKLEQQMQATARSLAGTDRKASSKVRDALGTMQQEELPLRMQWSADALRRGLGQYAVMRESVTTQALNNLRDQLKDVQRMMGGRDGKDGKPGAGDDKQMEQALAQVERLRRQMEQMRAGQQQGQGQQPGGQQGGQLQRGQQQGGQQQGGQQQGGQQGGQQAGQYSRGPQGGPYGGANIGPRGGGFYGDREGAWNRGPLPQYTGEPQGPRPGDIANAIRDAVRDLGRVQQTVRNDPALAREVQDLLRAMQNIDPKALDNPLVAERIRQQVLLEVEQVEMQIRRKVDDAQGTSARTPSAESVPPGYADAVAEYFRRLSRGK